MQKEVGEMTVEVDADEHPRTFSCGLVPGHALPHFFSVCEDFEYKTSQKTARSNFWNKKYMKLTNFVVSPSGMAYVVDYSGGGGAPGPTGPPTGLGGLAQQW